MTTKQTSFFGAGLRAFSKEKRLTLRQLAEKTGFSIPYLSEIMRGAKSPDEFVMRRISEPLGILPEDLMSNGRRITELSKQVVLETYAPLLERMARQLSGNDGGPSNDNFPVGRVNKKDRVKQ